MSSHYSRDLSSYERYVLNATRNIAEALGVIPTPWAIHRATGIDPVDVLDTVRTLQRDGMYPYAVMYPWSLDDPILTDALNVRDLLRASGCNCDGFSVANFLGVSPMEILVRTGFQGNLA